VSPVLPVSGGVGGMGAKHGAAAPGYSGRPRTCSVTFETTTVTRVQGRDVLLPTSLYTPLWPAGQSSSLPVAFPTALPLAFHNVAVKYTSCWNLSWLVALRVPGEYHLE